MANTVEQETKLAALVSVMRSKTTQLEFALVDPGEGAEYGQTLVTHANNILDTALDISKLAASVKSAVSE